MMNSYEYLKHLIEDGYFDDNEASGATGLRRLMAATDALLRAESPTEVILPDQQEELVQYWRVRQLKDSVECL